MLRRNLQVMTSEEAYLLYQERHADPVESVDAERLIDEIEGHLANISPTVRAAICVSRKSLQ